MADRANESANFGSDAAMGIMNAPSCHEPKWLANRKRGGTVARGARWLGVKRKS
jgi:hypothetical protein